MGTATHVRKGIDDRAPAPRSDVVGDVEVLHLTPPLVRGKTKVHYVFVAKRAGEVVVYGTTKYGAHVGRDATWTAPLWTSTVAETKDEALAALGYARAAAPERNITLVRELPGAIPGWQTVFRVDPPLIDTASRVEIRHVAVLKSYSRGAVGADIILVTEPRDIKTCADLHDFIRRGEYICAPSNITVEETPMAILQRGLP